MTEALQTMITAAFQWQHFGMLMKMSLGPAKLRCLCGCL